MENLGDLRGVSVVVTALSSSMLRARCSLRLILGVVRTLLLE